MLRYPLPNFAFEILPVMAILVVAPADDMFRLRVVLKLSGMSGDRGM